MIKKIIFSLICLFFINNYSYAANNKVYKITMGHNVLKLPTDVSDLKGNIINGQAYKFSYNLGGLYYSKSMGKVLAYNHFYILLYSNQYYTDIYSLDNDKTGTFSTVGHLGPWVFNSTYGNRMSRIKGMSELSGKLYMNLTNGDMYNTLGEVYPGMSGFCGNCYYSSSFIDYRWFDSNGNKIIIDNVFSPGTITFGNNVKLSYSSYHADYSLDSKILAFYSYPNVYAYKEDGTLIWSKNIITDLGLGQNPSLMVAGNEVLVQYGSLVKKVKTTGQVSTLIDFSQTAYPNSTIDKAAYNPSNHHLYFMSDNSGSVGVME